MARRTTIWLIALTMASTACGATDVASPNDPTTTPVTSEEPTTTPPDPTTLPEPTTTTGPALEDPRLAAARRDLAARLGVEPTQLEVVSFTEDVTWRDGSWGCPEPGMSYTQALVPDGYAIVLSVDGDEHTYHGAGDHPPRYCADPKDPLGENPDA